MKNRLVGKFLELNSNFNIPLIRDHGLQSEGTALDMIELKCGDIIHYRIDGIVILENNLFIPHKNMYISESFLYSNSNLNTERIWKNAPLLTDITKKYLRNEKINALFGN